MGIIIQNIKTNRVGTWKKRFGYYTAGGDPVWYCPNCELGDHVYGIEHEKNYTHTCSMCG